MNRREFVYAFGLASLSLIFSGCTSAGLTAGSPQRKGPPSHAPAHGYRRKNRHGLEMTFDSSIGVYVMLNYPMHYYWDGRYYRKRKDTWETSADIDRKWKGIKKEQLPRGLAGK